MKAFAKIAALLLPAAALACLFFPFHRVSLGQGKTMSVSGYAIMRGFYVSVNQQRITFPMQPLFMAGAILLAIAALCAFVGLFVRRGAIVTLYAAAATAGFAGSLAQAVMERGAYAYNNEMPKIIREIFSGGLSHAGVLFLITAASAMAAGWYLILTATVWGEKRKEAILADKFNAAYLALPIASLICFLFPFKYIEYSKLNSVIVYGFQFFTKVNITQDAVTATIPAQPMIIALAAVLAATIIVAAAVKGASIWKILLPVSAALVAASYLFVEMFTLGQWPEVPRFVRKLYDGSMRMPYNLIIVFSVLTVVLGILGFVIRRRPRLGTAIMAHSTLYLFMLPGIVIFILFNYMPMIGLVMVFQKYDPVSGFFKSPWVGLDNFRQIFSMPSFASAFRNTIYISVMKLIIIFPLPIIFAILLNELRMRKFKRVVQSISYLPNFISWVIVAGIFYQLLSPETGIINFLLVKLGIIDAPIMFMSSKYWFYPIIVYTDIWKGLGFSSILYMGAIANIDQELYEAAAIDGGGRLRMAIHITLPGLKTTIILLFIFAVSGILNAGFDQLWTMGNSAVRDYSEILDTLVLRYLTRGNLADLSLGAAMGFFKSIVGIMLFLAANLVSRLLKQESLI